MELFLRNILFLFHAYCLHRKYQKFFRKAQNYMVGYLEGFVAGPDLEKQIKNIKININPTGEPVWMTDVTIYILF